jgi:hypothetical protein
MTKQYNNDFIITNNADQESYEAFYEAFMDLVIENMRKEHKAAISLRSEITGNKARIIEQANAFEKEAFYNNHAFKIKELEYEFEVLEQANRPQQEVSLDGMLVNNCEWFIQ